MGDCLDISASLQNKLKQAAPSDGKQVVFNMASLVELKVAEFYILHPKARQLLISYLEDRSNEIQ